MLLKSTGSLNKIKKSVRLRILKDMLIPTLSGQFFPIPAVQASDVLG